MSFQNESGVPFSISHEQENFRLLELPPALLQLVTSNDPPILYLKSAVSNSSVTGAAVPNAVLCTNDATFEVRQIQSSNSLYILQPSHGFPRHGNDVSHRCGPGISAIAQCKAILEVVHTSASPLPYLKKRLPKYSPLQSGNPSGSVPSEAGLVTLQALLEDLPFSRGELENGLIELCVVEINDQMSLPSAHTLLLVWKSFISAANVKGTNIKSSFPISEVSALVEEDGFPEALLVAVFRKLASGWDASKPGWVTLDRDKCVQWVGTTLLGGYYGSTGVTVSSFIIRWQDLLHESWRELAVIEALGGEVIQKGEDTIAIRGSPDKTMKANDTTPVGGVPKGPSRWHDRFKHTRS